MRFDVYDQGSGRLLLAGVPLNEAAAYVGLDEGELAWAVEEFGRCDTDSNTVLAQGDKLVPNAT